jgi:hypothetical protein
VYTTLNERENVYKEAGKVYRTGGSNSRWTKNNDLEFMG